MRLFKQAFVLLSVLGTVLDGPRADILPRDHKPIQHTVRLVNASKVTNHVLYIYPRDLEHSRRATAPYQIVVGGFIQVILSLIHFTTESRMSR